MAAVAEHLLGERVQEEVAAVRQGVLDVLEVRRAGVMRDGGGGRWGVAGGAKVWAVLSVKQRCRRGGLGAAGACWMGANRLRSNKLTQDAAALHGAAAGSTTQLLVCAVCFHCTLPHPLPPPPSNLCRSSPPASSPCPPSTPCWRAALGSWTWRSGAPPPSARAGQAGRGWAAAAAAGRRARSHRCV